MKAELEEINSKSNAPALRGVRTGTIEMVKKRSGAKAVK